MYDEIAGFIGFLLSTYPTYYLVDTRLDPKKISIIAFLTLAMLIWTCVIFIIGSLIYLLNKHVLHFRSEYMEHQKLIRENREIEKQLTRAFVIEDNAGEPQLSSKGYWRKPRP